jgi:hypothetical protein
MPSKYENNLFITGGKLIDAIDPSPKNQLSFKCIKSDTADGGMAKSIELTANLVITEKNIINAITNAAVYNNDDKAIDSLINVVVLPTIKSESADFNTYTMPIIGGTINITFDKNEIGEIVIRITAEDMYKKDHGGKGDHGTKGDHSKFWQ